MFTREQYRATLEAIDTQWQTEANADPGIQMAWLSLEQAQGKLEQEQLITQNLPLDPRWAHWTSAQRNDVRSQMADRLTAAKQAIANAKLALNEAQNAYAGKKWAAKLQAERNEVAQKQANEQAQHSMLEEANAKEQFLGRYLVAGGTTAQFEKEWPEMWKQELIRRVQAQEELAKQRLQASGKYDF